jgi:hypothetical protein
MRTAPAGLSAATGTLQSPLSSSPEQYYALLFRDFPVPENAQDSVYPTLNQAITSPLDSSETSSFPAIFSSQCGYSTCALCHHQRHQS